MNLTLKQDSVLKLLEGTRRTPYHSLLIVYSPYYLPVNEELSTYTDESERDKSYRTVTRYYSKNYIQYID